jgi:hypothetical protein
LYQRHYITILEGNRKIMRFFPSMIAIPISFQMIFYLILYLAQLFKNRRGLHVWDLYAIELQILCYIYIYIYVCVCVCVCVLLGNFTIKLHTKSILTKHKKLFFFNHNFNRSFNQTHQNLKRTSQKVLFIKLLF